MRKELPDIPLPDFLDLLLDAVCVVDIEGYFIFVSAACERIFGYRQDEMVGMRVHDMVHPDDLPATLQSIANVMAGNTNTLFENRYIRKDGETVHIMWTALWSEADQLRIGVARDITQRKQAEALQQALYAISEAANTVNDLPSLYEHIHRIINGLMRSPNFMVALYDKHHEKLSYPYYLDEKYTLPPSGALEDDPLTAQVIKQQQALFLHPDSPSALAPSQTDIPRQAPLYWLGVPLLEEDQPIGALVIKSYSAKHPYTEKDKDLLHFVSDQIVAAITRRNMLSQLEFHAQFDPLTQLPNRALLDDRLAGALARARREQKQLALLFMDLNDFKRINDDFGHAAGDHILQIIGERLKSCLRETDTVARVGGDEFVILLENISSPADAEEISGKIKDSIGQSFQLEGRKHSLTCSIGIALYPQHGSDKHSLLQYADQAMYTAKSEITRPRKYR